MGYQSIFTVVLLTLAVPRLRLVAGDPQLDSSMIGQERIVGGRDAYQGEVPYQLGIRKWGGHQCGASLTEVHGIQVAITAAHCVSAGRIEDFTLVAGDLSVEDTTGFEQVRDVARIIVHEEFNEPLIHNDLAILFPDRPFQLDRNVGIVHLPNELEETSGNLVISGWGSLHGGAGAGAHYSDKLQLVTMPVVDFDVCRKRWKHHPDLMIKISEGIICSGVPTGEKSPCFGDSGSPARSIDGHYLAGVVVIGDPSCNHPKYPVLFTEVSHYVTWIHDQVAKYMRSKHQKD